MMMSSSNSMASCSSSSSSSSSNRTNYIQHHVSKMDTLAGVAIKYGVEVADIKRMNGLVTDLQMFALKTLQIPSPGRHPPSPCLSNDPATAGGSQSEVGSYAGSTMAYHAGTCCRESTVEQIAPCRARSGLREPFQSFGLKTPQRRVSPAMSSLQGYYGLKPPNRRGVEEGTEMAVYRTGRANQLEDELLPKPSPVFDTPPRKHKSRSLVNGFLPEEGDLADDTPVADAGDAEADKSGEKSVRRRQKADADMGSRTPGIPSKEENSGVSGFSGSIGKSPALRPKSGSRNTQPGDADISWLNPIPVGLGDSLMADGFAGFRKSSSTSNLQDPDSNGSSSIWPTSRWSLKPDLQSLSAAAIARPIFDGLPKPGNGRRNKAALD